METEKILSDGTEKATCEVWRPIKGFEGLYDVSNFGNVRSSNRKAGGRFHILTPSDNGRGYMVVGLKNKGYRKNFYIHRLVAEAFLDNPRSCEQVNHIDYNTKNNNVTNLEWVTRSENIRHSLPRRKKTRKVNRSSVGVQYICKRGDKYRVTIYRKYDRQFYTLEEAIEARNKIIKELNYV